MSKLTVCEMRKRQLENFNNNYIKDIEKASYLFNAYYRYVALSRRLLELENNERTYNTRYTKSLQEKENRIYKNLSSKLAVYGISIYTPWITPCLGIKDPENGCIISVVIEPILY